MKSENLIYEESTGKVALLLQGSDSETAAKLVRLNTPEGHAAMSVEVGSTQTGASYIEAGVPVVVPPAPSENHVFDYNLKQWVDPRTLDDLKVIKTAEINAARLKANRGTFTFAGKVISCDELSRSDIDGVNGHVSLTGALPPNWPGGWKVVDNTYVPIPDVATWTIFYSAMVAQGQENFAHSQALKAALVLAESAEDVADIVW